MHAPPHTALWLVYACSAKLYIPMHDLAQRIVKLNILNTTCEIRALAQRILHACNLVLSLVRSLSCSHVLLLVSTLMTACTANRTRTRTNTNPNDTEANAAGRSGNARALRKQSKCGVYHDRQLLCSAWLINRYTTSLVVCSGWLIYRSTSCT